MVKALQDDNFEIFRHMCQKFFFEDIAASKVCEKMGCKFIPVKGFYNQPPSNAAKQWPSDFSLYSPASFHMQHDTTDMVALDMAFSSTPTNATKKDDTLK